MWTTFFSKTSCTYFHLKRNQTKIGKMSKNKFQKQKKSYFLDGCNEVWKFLDSAYKIKELKMLSSNYSSRARV